MVGLLATGEAMLYDSRVLHCGGPHSAAAKERGKEKETEEDGQVQTTQPGAQGHEDIAEERVLFYAGLLETQRRTT